MATTTHPKGMSDRVITQVTSHAMQPAMNHISADSTRPCTSWPRPGMIRLQMAAMMSPAEPGPLPMRKSSSE